MPDEIDGAGYTLAEKRPAQHFQQGKRYDDQEHDRSGDHDKAVSVMPIEVQGRIHH